ncbi:MAG TPA: glycosyltransferase family 39 protein [Afipia sp.]
MDIRKSGWRRPFERWLDGVEPGWAVPALLAVFVALCMLVLLLAFQGGDLHGDALETWTLGRELAWGQSKHPPLMGWVARVWSSAFPLTDWSFYLLAMLNSAAALFAVDLISRRFVRGDGRVVILLLLLFFPAYHVHAQRFSANTVLLATWPLATYCFLRSFETRAWTWAAAAGAVAALAMLGKYYSVFLIAGFAIAAAAHPQRRIYFTSPAPWVSVFTGLVVLAPHLWWLATHDMQPFDYALSWHGGLPRVIAIEDAFNFTVGNAAYLALPVGIWLLMIRMNLRTFASNLATLDPGLALLLWIFAATVFLPPVVSIALDTDLPRMWNLQALFLVIVVMVAAAKFRIDRFDTVNLSAGMAGLLAGAVLAAPLYALYHNTHPLEYNRSFIRGAVQDITRRWHEATGERFAVISGDDSLAFGTAFYSPDHPVYMRSISFRHTWMMPDPASLDKGWAAMCIATDQPCVSWLQRVAQSRPSAVLSEFEVQARLWGRPGASIRISALIVPPRPVSPGNSPEADTNSRVEDFRANRHLQ